MGANLSAVAAHAGVSTATVSRVLNGRAGVSEATRASVLASVDVLGFQRPAQLIPRRSGQIGLIVPELDDPVVPLFAQFIESCLAQAGYMPLLCTRTPGGVTESEYVDLLRGHGVAGIIFVSGLHGDSTADLTHYHRLIDSGIPTVLIGGYTDEIDAAFVSTDDIAAMDQAVRHLVELGHTRIGLAVGSDRFVASQRKSAGFARAVHKYLGSDAEVHIASSLSTVEGGAAAATRLVGEQCTAIVCGSDLIALGAIRAVRREGLEVPRDVSIVGYDDSRLMAFTDPALTTIRQPVLAMGSAAVDALVDEIGGQARLRDEMLFTPELVLRESTASVPVSRSVVVTR
ncbi:MAG: LacI family DNA-binding transcriptional regulator [Microbacterium sp.]